jgi:carboxymethylenebutenolidase
METMSETIDLVTPDGPMATVVSRPADGGTYPGIIIIQEAFGVNGHVQNVGRRFAAEGYVTATPDMFHRAGRLQTAPYGDFDAVGKLRVGMSDDGIINDLSTMVEHLQGSPVVSSQEMGIVGYCMGGRISFMAACKVSGIGDAAVYYGGGIVPRQDQTASSTPVIEMANGISCAIIGFFGGQDQEIPVEAVNQIDNTLESLSKDAEIILYPDAGHGFFCDERESYNQNAAEDAWGKTLGFFERHLTSTPVSA